VSRKRVPAARFGRVIGRLIAGMAGIALLVAPACALAGPGSLYSGPAPKPGPSILYAKPKTAPQLKNAGIWEAKPILVSGASAYRKGEFLYQDFIYDDTGAKGTADPADPKSGATFARFNGTLSYPTDPRYAQNAADLLELRVQPLRRSTAFRLTFNSMTDPELVATTIAIGESAEPREFPHGAGVSAPAELFLTVHGRSAELASAADGAVLATPRVKVSTRRHQLEVRVARGAWNPGSSRVRLAAGSGLWDAAAGAYLRPAAAADADTPGGGGASTPALFNVAFRFAEPFPDLGSPGEVFTDPKWWRDADQAAALAAGDISEFYAEVDFAKLRRGVRDLSGVPSTGPINRILSSRFNFGEGASWGSECDGTTDCPGQLLGRLLPYSVYVPERPRPPRGYGLTLLLHSLGANFNQFSASNNQSQLGDRAPGSLVITPSGRGTDGWYYGVAGADTFEVWADVARRYRLNPALTSISGYSMGGYGTYKLAAQYPDLFAAGQPVVGPPGQGVWVPPNEPSGGAGSNTNRMLASLRHVPFLIFNGALDELVPIAGPTAQAQSFDDLGYRYVFDVFPTADHFALAVNDSYGPAADFLGRRRATRNPAHVTYVVNPAMDFAQRGTVADHAYWLSKLRLRDASGEAPLGRVDAVSGGFGKGDPQPLATETGAGTLPPGNLGELAYTERSRAWGPAPRVARADRLQLTAENLKRIVVHPRRARLSCSPELDIETDGPLKLKLAGCGKPLRFG
jgi:dienelactone hydrolase